MSIVAVVLLALGVDSNFVRQSAAAPDPGHRVVPVLTTNLPCVGEPAVCWGICRVLGILLCVGLALALAPVRSTRDTT